MGTAVDWETLLGYVEARADDPRAPVESAARCRATVEEFRRMFDARAALVDLLDQLDGIGIPDWHGAEGLCLERSRRAAGLDSEQCEACKGRGYLVACDQVREAHYIERCDACEMYDSDGDVGASVPLDEQVCAVARVLIQRLNNECGLDDEEIIDRLDLRKQGREPR